MMKKIPALICLVLAFSIQHLAFGQSTPTTVKYSANAMLYQLTGSTQATNYVPLTNVVTLTPYPFNSGNITIMSPSFYGTLPIYVYPDTNGIAYIAAAPNDYIVNIAGINQGVRISVPISTNVLNMADLVTQGAGTPIYTNPNTNFFVAVDTNDTTPALLWYKIAAGTNITLVVTNVGGNEQLLISSSGGSGTVPAGILTNGSIITNLSGILPASQLPSTNVYDGSFVANLTMTNSLTLGPFLFQFSTNVLVSTNAGDPVANGNWTWLPLTGLYTNYNTFAYRKFVGGQWSTYNSAGSERYRGTNGALLGIVDTPINGASPGPGFSFGWIFSVNTGTAYFNTNAPISGLNLLNVNFKSAVTWPDWFFYQQNAGQLIGINSGGQFVENNNNGWNSNGLDGLIDTNNGGFQGAATTDVRQITMLNPSNQFGGTVAFAQNWSPTNGLISYTTPSGDTVVSNPADGSYVITTKSGLNSTRSGTITASGFVGNATYATNSGTAAFANAAKANLLITNFYSMQTRFADAMNGSDANDGSENSPWATIACAQTNTPTGWLLVLNPGTYATAVTNFAIDYLLQNGATATFRPGAVNTFTNSIDGRGTVVFDTSLGCTNSNSTNNVQVLTCHSANLYLGTAGSDCLKSYGARYTFFTDNAFLNLSANNAGAPMPEVNPSDILVVHVKDTTTDYNIGQLDIKLDTGTWLQPNGGGNSLGSSNSVISAQQYIATVGTGPFAKLSWNVAGFRWDVRYTHSDTNKVAFTSTNMVFVGNPYFDTTNVSVTGPYLGAYQTSDGLLHRCTNGVPSTF